MDFIIAASSAVMALVWVVYFQLFFAQYKRNNRPYLVVHHAQNESLDSLCLLVNMGTESVHVQCVQAVIQDCDGQSRQLTVTEYERINPQDRNVHEALRQGPLQAGGYLVLGSFRNILLGRKSRDDESNHLLENIETLEIRVAVIHGPSKRPVGARRRFVLRGKPNPRIYPYNIHTEQLIRRRDQATVRRWIEEELNPRRVGGGESDTSTQSEQQAEAD